MTGQVALMEKISALLADGVAPNEIAILYTKNRYGKELMPLLSSWGIPFHVEGGLDALAQPIVQ
jgi:superfamily I DNA/RNA helicase